MLLHLTIKPNSRENIIERDQAGQLKARIKAPAVDGKANEALIAFLADYFSIPKSAVALVKGQRSRIKTIELSGDEEKFLAKLRQI